MRKKLDEKGPQTMSEAEVVAIAVVKNLDHSLINSYQRISFFQSI